MDSRRLKRRTLELKIREFENSIRFTYFIYIEGILLIKYLFEFGNTIECDYGTKDFLKFLQLLVSSCNYNFT